MDITMIVDTIWVVLAAVLVFFMNLGFAAVESRQLLTRSASPGLQSRTSSDTGCRKATRNTSAALL